MCADEFRIDSLEFFTTCYLLLEVESGDTFKSLNFSRSRYRSYAI